MGRQNLGRVIRYNIIFFIALALLAEFGAWCLMFYNMNFDPGNASAVVLRRELDRISNGGLIFPTYYSNTQRMEEHFSKSILRPAAIPYPRDRNRKPIAVFGCSFAYGEKLRFEQTLPYKLAAETGRAAFNYAFGGFGIQHMLYMLENGIWIGGTEEPEFVLYIFINDHIPRLHTTFGNNSGGGAMAGFLFHHPVYLSYEEQDGRLVEKKHRFPWLRYSFLVSQIDEAVRHRMFYGGGLEKNPGKAAKYAGLMKLHFLQASEAARKIWPHAKFVIARYDLDGTVPDSYWKELGDAGIVVLSLPEITGVDLRRRDLRLEHDEYHPNERAWDIIAPAVAAKLEELSGRGAVLDP